MAGNLFIVKDKIKEPIDVNYQGHDLIHLPQGEDGRRIVLTISDIGTILLHIDFLKTWYKNKMRK